MNSIDAASSKGCMLSFFRCIILPNGFRNAESSFKNDPTTSLVFEPLKKIQLLVFSITLGALFLIARAALAEVAFFFPTDLAAALLANEAALLDTFAPLLSDLVIVWSIGELFSKTWKFQVSVSKIGQRMLDFAIIFSKSGLILWSKTWAKLRPTASGESPVDALVRTILLEDKGGASRSANIDSYTLKWTFENESDVVIVVVYQKVRSLVVHTFNFG